MKRDPIFVHEKTGTKGRIVAKHTYLEQPDAGQFASIKDPNKGTIWVPISELREATALEAAAPVLIDTPKLGALVGDTEASCRKILGIKAA